MLVSSLEPVRQASNERTHAKSQETGATLVPKLSDARTGYVGRHRQEYLDMDIKIKQQRSVEKIPPWTAVTDRSAKQTSWTQQNTNQSH